MFREEKDEHSELQLWEYWHLQQPNQLLRAFDVDRKSANNVESIEDVAHNATAFVWDACKPARVSQCTAWLSCPHSLILILGEV